MPEVWNTALLVELNIADKIDIKFHPIQMKDAGIELAKGEDYDKIMNAFYDRNEEWKNGTWLKGWEDFCETEREAFTNWLKEIGEGVEGSMERIAHFMVCEAHFDVLLQLFQTKHRTNRL